jgi:hypothetical protein
LIEPLQGEQGKVKMAAYYKKKEFLMQKQKKEAAKHQKETT